MFSGNSRVCLLLDIGGHFLWPFHGHPVRNVPLVEDGPSEGILCHRWHMGIFAGNGHSPFGCEWGLVGFFFLN
jgi:hypothetical protein